MLVPQAITKEQAHITVLLSNMHDDELKDFHCSICGRIVFQYFSPIRMIVPGNPGIEFSAPLVIQCSGVLPRDFGLGAKRCKGKYFVT